MNHTRELRLHWKPLLAATLGLAMGASLLGYINSIFAPQLVKEFAWTRANFALTAMVSSVAVLCIPIVGRLTDRFGVRPVATVGLISFPLTFVGMSQMSGSIHEYVFYNVIQMTLCVTTTATVYSRIVAERFVATRGTALAILTCGPAISGALLSPLLAWVIDMYGWRTAYHVLAVVLGLSALIVRAILPPPRAQPVKASGAMKDKGMAVLCPGPVQTRISSSSCQITGDDPADIPPNIFLSADAVAQMVLAIKELHRAIEAALAATPVSPMFDPGLPVGGTRDWAQAMLARQK